MKTINLYKNSFSETDNLTDKFILAFILLFILSSTFSIAVSQIAYFTALAFWLFKMIRERKSYPQSTPFDYYFLFFIMAELISTIFSQDFSQSLFSLHKRLVIIPIIYLIGYWLNTQTKLELGVVVLLSSAFLVSLYGVYDVVTNITAYLNFERRVNLFHFYMTAGGLMMISGLLILSFISSQGIPKNYKIAGIISLIPILISLLFTFTRSSWLGFIGGTIMISFYRSKKISLILLLAIIVIIMIAPAGFQDRIFSIVNIYHPNNVERLQMWQTGWAVFLDNPLIGVGDIGTEIFFEKYGPPGANPAGHLHNNFINWLVKLGLVGFVIIILMFVKILLTELKTVARTKENWLLNSVALGSAAALIGFHINGLFEWNFGDTEVIMFLWITVGFALSALKIKEKNLNVRNEK